ncbi:MAG TPA: prepilin-type N-terminal cleavage/methylation domain-containing protein [Thermoanaerobaculia bacterium]|nr:prepilin-type N-terminal cleavage/methylation domain-containing protein [Thermoanaerobaculia bacterium]
MKLETKPGQRGFSVVEVLIAAAIFLIIAVGVLPLFVQSMRNNASGRDATEISHVGKSRVEELLQVPYNALEIPAGTTESVVEDYWSRSTEAWVTGTPTASDADALWLRTTRVRQFGLNDLTADGIADIPLDGGTPAGQVHFKEIVVEIRSGNENIFSSGKSLTLRMLRAI